jgi:signal recognition particle subunit SRP54
MSGVMQDMAGMGMRDRLKAVRNMADGGMLNPGARFPKDKQRSKRGPLDQAKLQDKKRKLRKEAKRHRKRNRR